MYCHHYRVPDQLPHLHRFPTGQSGTTGDSVFDPNQHINRTTGMYLSETLYLVLSYSQRSSSSLDPFMTHAFFIISGREPILGEIHRDWGVFADLSFLRCGWFYRVCICITIATIQRETSSAA